MNRVLYKTGSQRSTAVSVLAAELNYSAPSSQLTYDRITNLFASYLNFPIFTASLLPRMFKFHGLPFKSNLHEFRNSGGSGMLDLRVGPII